MIPFQEPGNPQRRVQISPSPVRLLLPPTKVVIFQSHFTIQPATRFTNIFSGPSVTGYGFGQREEGSYLNLGILGELVEEGLKN